MCMYMYVFYSVQLTAENVSKTTILFKKVLDTAKFVVEYIMDT